MSCYRPPIQSRKLLCGGFAVVLKLNFGFPNLGNGAPMGMGLRGVRWGVNDSLQIALQSPWCLS